MLKLKALARPEGLNLRLARASLAIGVQRLENVSDKVFKAPKAGCATGQVPDSSRSVPTPKPIRSPDDQYKSQCGQRTDSRMGHQASCLGKLDFQLS